ncbi:uncharacterized protein LOC127805680 isoform X1 [Diospyros lotus]|uniref:uncharacterized protein LOC127805680 isoform X1 n=1 Tax=Diospyros lotus TaxID=55363 RepID=UPI00225C3181|nr:uncharacterized protein LOC127805680 isoform X1 [Diospyros lotus]
MLENPSDSSPAATVKRYGPPNQRARSLGRRKSGGERIDRINSNYPNDGEKSQIASSRNVPVAGHGDALGSYLANDNTNPGLIPLHGCSKSKSVQLLNQRWAATIKAYNDPSIDLAERPVMYSGSSASAWGHFRLPHQMDFLNELRRAMHNASANPSSKLDSWG